MESTNVDIFGIIAAINQKLGREETNFNSVSLKSLINVLPNVLSNKFKLHLSEEMASL